MEQSHTPTVVVVFGAGIEGCGTDARLDQESQFALNWAVNVAQAHCGAPIIALPGYSQRRQAHLGELFRKTAATMLCSWAPVERRDYATQFNSLGEARAFWRWVDTHYRGHATRLQHVPVVTRGVHSWRTWFLIWRVRPARYHHVNITRHQAPSKDAGLLWYELLAWIKVIAQLVSGTLSPLK